MFKGIAVSPGIVVGTVFRVESVFGSPEPVPLGDPTRAPEEVERFHQAVARSAQELETIVTKVHDELGAAEAGIFRTHLGIVRDPQLTRRVVERIENRKLTALSALHQVLQDYAATFAQIEQEYFKERVADIRDVISRIAAHLTHRAAPPAPEPGEDPIVLVAHDLLPSQAMELGEFKMGGIVTEVGGGTSHAAILARSRGIPAVSGVTGILQEVRTGDLIAVDGREGLLIARPDPETASAYRKMQREFFLIKDRLVANRDKPAVSGDGGHPHTFSVACRIVERVLHEDDAWAVLVDWNETCQPPWSDEELRHKLDDALRAHELGELADDAGQTRRRAAEDVVDVLAERAPDLAGWDLHLLQLALRLDPTLRAGRRRWVKKQRPRATKLSPEEMKYVSGLVRVGLPQEVVVAEVVALAGSKVDAISEFRAAVVKEYPAKTSASLSRWGSVCSGVRAVSTGVDGAAPTTRHLTNVAVEGSAAALDSGAVPSVSVVLTRPGHGKTRGVIDVLASRGRLMGRTAFCGSMVRELLRHEHAINAAYPYGLMTTFNGVEAVFDPELPIDHNALWNMLPSKVKERADVVNLEVVTVGQRRQFRKLWTPEKLKTVAPDAGAFFINAFHPRSVDEALKSPDDAPVLPAWLEPDDAASRQPRAVMKFRGREDLCLAGRSRKQLRDRRTCLEWCDFYACRANKNRKHGGAKTYWSDAPFPLLTHQAYVTQAVFAPAYNDFDAAVFDELPSFVYRYPKLKVSPGTVKEGRGYGWKVEPLDRLVAAVRKKLGQLDPADPETTEVRTATESILDHLKVECDRVSKKASARMHDAQNAGRDGMYKVHRLDPLLSREEFDNLAEVMGLAEVEPDDESEPADGDAGEDPATTLLTDFALLNDFCGGEPINVFLESAFQDGGKGAMFVCRPVEGWATLLNNPDGRPRGRTVLLDATAGIDPRYLLAGWSDVEEVPDGQFPNTTIVLTSSNTVSKKGAKELGADRMAEALVRQVSPYLSEMVDPRYQESAPKATREPKLLVVTAKRELEAQVRDALAPYRESGRLPAIVEVQHFGGLRGRNDFRDFDAVYLTHAHRYDGPYYYGLELLLRDFGKPFAGQWARTDEWMRHASKGVLYRAMASDIYQDVLRIGIRTDPTRRAFIFLPTEEAGLVVRVLRMFRGARLVLQDGEQVLSPLPMPAPAPTTKPVATPAAKPPGASRWGTPKYD